MTEIRYTVSEMADYYPLIARAIAGLDSTATGEQRRALYERARSALIAQLRGVQPPLSESDITRERLTLEEAIRKVEQEGAQRGRAAARAERMVAVAPDAGLDQSRCGGARRTAAATNDRARAGSTRSRRPPTRGPAGAAPASAAERARGHRAPPPPRNVASAGYRPRMTRPQEPRPAPRENRAGTASRAVRGMAQRRDRGATGPSAATISRVPDNNGTDDGRAWFPRRDGGRRRSWRRRRAGQPVGAPDLRQRAVADAGVRPARAEHGGPRRERDAPQMAQSAEDRALRILDESPAEAERYQGRQQGREPPREQRTALRAGIFPVKRAAAVGVVLILIGAAVAYWPQLRGIYSDLTGRAKQVGGCAEESETPPIGRRSPIASASRRPRRSRRSRSAWCSMTRIRPSRRASSMSARWSGAPRMSQANGTTDIAIRADIDIPDRKFKAALTIRRNNDTSLPASHTVEMTFQFCRRISPAAASRTSLAC